MLRDMDSCKQLNLRGYIGRRKSRPYRTCATMAQIGVDESVR